MRFLGLEFTDLDAVGAAGLLARRSASEPFGYVTTPNADHLVRFHRRPELHPLYQNAMLRLLDSRVVALAARMVGLPTPHVAPGSDLTALLLSRHVTAHERITIVGPALASALVQAWNSSPVRNHARPPGCSAPVWNGCTASAAIRAVWRGVI